MIATLPRRDFMAIHLAALASAACGQVLAHAAENGPRRLIGLGFSLYGMRELPAATALSTIAEIGYDCVELPVMKAWPYDPAELNAAARAALRGGLSDRGLRLSALMENLPIAGIDASQHREQLERLKRAAELGHELSPDQTPVIETILGGRPDQWEVSKSAMAERLVDWVKTAEAAKVVLAIKAHVGGAMHRPEHVVWLLEQIGSRHLKAAYDFSHFQLRGLDLAESIGALIPHSVFIHVKDGRGDASQFQFLLPGEGTIDYAALLKLAAAGGYAGDVVVEVSGQIHSRAGYDPMAAAKKSYGPLAAAFQAAGLPRG